MKSLYTIIAATAMTFSAGAADLHHPVSMVKRIDAGTGHADSPARTATKTNKAKVRGHRSGIFKAKDTSNNPDDKTLTLIDETFAWATSGTEAEPVIIETDESGNIPVSLIGESGYGFFGGILGQAGGALFVDNDNRLGYLSSPTFDCNGNFTVSFKIKPTNFDSTNDLLTVVAIDDRTNNALKIEYDDLVEGWKEYRFSFAGSTSPIRIEVYSDVYDFVIKDFKVVGKIKALNAPTTKGYTDFTETSFVANWNPVEKATGYLLTVYEYDDVNKSPVTPYLLVDKAVGGTSHKVEGIEPGNIYYYEVQATDGRNYSDVSNIEKVTALPVPQNPHGAFNENNDIIKMNWDGVSGADSYEVEIGTMITMNEAGDFTLANLSFDDINSNGTVEYPEEPDDYVLFPENAPAWTIVMPYLIQGGIGCTYHPMFAMFGYPGQIQSPTFHFYDKTAKKIHVEVEAASSSESPIKIQWAFYNDDMGSFIAATYINDDIDTEFQTYTADFDYPSGVDPSKGAFLVISPVSLYGEEADVFVRSIKISSELAQGEKVSWADDYTMVRNETEALYEATPAPDTLRTMAVTALQYKESGDVRLSSEKSETAIINQSQSGVENISAENAGGPVEFYNLQGVRIKQPVQGQLVIRRQGSTVSKTVF